MYMEILSLVIAALALLAVTIEVICRVVARHSSACFKFMSPDEQRKEQERAYRSHAYNSGV